MSRHVYGAIITDESSCMKEVRGNGELDKALKALRPVLGELTVGTHSESRASSLLEAVAGATTVGPFSHSDTDIKLVAIVSNSHCEDGESKEAIVHMLSQLPDRMFVVLVAVGRLEPWGLAWFNFLANKREEFGGKFDVVRLDQGEDVREAFGRHVRPFVEQASA